MSEIGGDIDVPERREPIFTRDFDLTWIASFFGYASFYFLLSTIPLYVKSVGGTEFQVGLVVGMFSAVSLCVRAPLGNACDAKGPRIFMMIGALFLVLCGFVYSLCHSVSSLIAARALHGLGWAFFGTSVYAQVAETIPASRRGEAMGYYGISCNLAMALGPAFGFSLIADGDFSRVFALSSTMATVAFLAASPIGKKFRKSAKSSRIDEPQVAEISSEICRDQPPKGASEKHHFFEKSALLPASVMGLTSISYSAAISFIPLYAKGNGVENPGFFFTVYAIALVVSRAITGRLSDIFGRAKVIVPGLMCIVLALMVAAPNATSVAGLATTGILFGFGFSTAQSTIMALIADRAPKGHRGAAMGTYMTAMDLGIGLGALFCGLLSDALGFRGMFTIAGLTTLCAIVLFIGGELSERSGGLHIDVILTRWRHSHPR